MNIHELEEQAMWGIAPGTLQKAEKPSPGVGNSSEAMQDAYKNVLKSFVVDEALQSDGRGIRENIPALPDVVLRLTERRNPIISSAVNLRCMQAKQFAKPATDKYSAGFQIQTLDPEEKPEGKKRKFMRELERFFYNYSFNVEATESPLQHDEGMPECLPMMMREYLTIDKIAIEPRKDNGGKVMDLWQVDAATIKRVINGGYLGSKGDFDPRVHLYGQTDFQEKLAEAKLQKVPPMNEIAYVQEIDGRLTAAYRNNELIFDIRQHRVDVRYKGQGYSPVEQAILAVNAFLNAMNYNTAAFDIAAIPKIGLAFENGSFDKATLRAFQQEWRSNFKGIRGQWQMPILNGKVSVIDFLKNNRDMEYSTFMNFVASLIYAVMGVDPTELGLRLSGAQNVMNDNLDGKQMFSKSRGLHDLLTQAERVYNRLLKVMGLHKEFIFAFTGLDPDDRQSKLEADKTRLSYYMTVNEIRAQNDLPAVENGDMILNSVFFQNTIHATQAQQGGDGGDQGGGQGGFDPSMFDDAIDQAADTVAPQIAEAIQKAARRPALVLPKPRTLLI